MLNTILIIVGAIGAIDLILVLAFCRAAKRSDQRLWEPDPQLLGDTIPMRSGANSDQLPAGRTTGVRL
jgi:hypothetical protein